MFWKKDSTNLDLPRGLERWTTEELLEELGNRHDAGVVLLRQSLGPGRGKMDMAFFGDPYSCLGMADLVVQKLREAIREGEVAD